MSIKFTKLTKLSKILLGASIFTLFSLPMVTEAKPLGEEFKDTFFSHGKSSFTQGKTFARLDTFLGFAGFAELHINSDGEALDKLYQEVLEQQASRGERMVTRDLPNPYDTSLRENPSYSAIK